MSRLSRDKGARREREIVDRHKEMGVHAERVPLSGAMVYRKTQGTDVDIYPWGKEAPPLVSEVKARKNGHGFVQLETWLGDADALFLVRDRASPMVVLPWETWARLLGRGT